MFAISFREFLGLRKTPARQAYPRQQFGLSLEILEDRAVPATLEVGAYEHYTTIQSAVNAAHAGDTVLVDPGVYQEQVTINKSITLEGQSNYGYCYGPTQAAVIEAPTNLGAPTAANPDAIVRVTGSGTSVTIENLTIEGAAGGTTNLLYGVRVDGNAAARILNSTITNIIDSSNPEFGVGIDAGNGGNPNGPSDGTGPQVGTADIENDTISNYQRAGIVINNTGSSAEIANNSITASATDHPNSQTGVEVSYGAVADIEYNLITGNTNGSDGTGILLVNPGAVRQAASYCGNNYGDGSCYGGYGYDYGYGYDCGNGYGNGCGGYSNNVLYTTVSNNVLTNNDLGLFAEGLNLTLASQPASAAITNNWITCNTYNGIWLDGSSHVVINSNYLSGNGSDNQGDGGIYLGTDSTTGDTSTNNTITNNVSMNNNGSGLYLDVGSTGNVVQNNLLTGNVYNPTLGNADAVDLTTGTGTAGTANTWSNNQGQTYIDNSGVTLFQHQKFFECY